jgi:hypothetical protein
VSKILLCQPIIAWKLSKKDDRIAKVTISALAGFPTFGGARGSSDLSLSKGGVRKELSHTELAGNAEKKK